MTHPRTPPPARLPITGNRLPPWLWGESGGMLVSGDSGSGKSTFLCLLMVLLARLGQGFTLFDPHGDLARKVQRLCLSLGDSVARRLYVVTPGDTSVVTKFHPLGVERGKLTDYAWRARVTEKCGHVARILLHAWGESDFNGKPLLYKYTNLVLTTAALLGLPVAAIRHLLQVESPLFEVLTRVAPDLFARLELGALMGLRVREREDLIGSTKNRFLGFLSNPVVEAALAHTEGTLEPRRLLKERAILLFDLSPREVLREEDREIFSNLWLSELVHAIFATPEAERVPYWIFLDELPVFASSAPLITASLRQTRKFLSRFVCATQGCNYFADRTEDRLLHALVGQAGTHVLFRHTDPVDAKFFGEVLALPGFSPHKVKHVLRQPMQYTAGQNLVVLTDRSESWGEANQRGGSDADGTTATTTRSEASQDSQTRSEGESRDEETLRKTVNEARATVSGRTTTADGRSHTATATWSETQTQGGGRTRRQTLVPDLRWRDVVTSVTFLSPEEQTLLPARTLAGLPTGQALLSVAGHGVQMVTIPFVEDPYRQTPRFAAKKEDGLQQRLRNLPAYAEPASALGEHEAFLAAWLAKLRALDHQDSLPPGPEDAGPAAGEEASPLGI